VEGGDGSEERRRVWWLISALDRGCKLWNNKKTIECGGARQPPHYIYELVACSGNHENCSSCRMNFVRDGIANSLTEQ
jgi:hypothetical protein